VSILTVVADRLTGRYEVDEYGEDRQLIDLLDPVVRQVLHVVVDGARFLPATGPAVLVANRRVGMLEPFVLGQGVRQATGRQPRFLGIPDVAPLGPILRRLGGAVNRPDELGGLLRAGHLATLPLGSAWRRPLRAGALAPESLAPALELDVPVIPVAMVGGELSGRWQVTIGAPVARPASRGPLALAELADEARAGVQALLDEAFPPRWPFA
jgi:hypothetical protein